MIKLSIIIVNYKTPQLVIDCIRSIKNWPDRIGFEIIVVDNSPDISGKAIVLDVFPDVIWFFMDCNAGFARANNLGIEQSRGDVCLLLNSDTIVLDDAVQRCYESFVHSAFIACGVQLLNSNGTPQISGNFFMKGSLNNLLPLPVIGSCLKFLGNVIGVKKPHIPDSDEVKKVDWINGAFLMVKKSVLKDVGLLDPDFFLYAEEAEWCSRLSKKGELCIYGQYKVTHLQGESANQTFSSKSKGYYDLYSRKGLQIMLSNMVRIRKQFGVFWLLVHYGFYFLEVPLFTIWSGLRYIVSLGRGVEFSNNPFLYFLNVCRLLRYLPTIIRGKPYFYKVI